MHKLAQINLQNSGDQFKPLTGLEVPDIVSGLIKGAMVVAAVIFFFILVIGGIRWIASGGDKSATEGARSQITAALVGLIIVFAAWAIVALIQTFFGINIFSLALPSVN
jgi:hypothetical protein